MFIKEILKYNYNYAEYIVTDGKNELICICLSVPLLSNQRLQTGMKVSIIDAFSYKGTFIRKIEDNERQITIQKGKSWFEYVLCGRIIDVNKALVQVEGFTISLENDFVDGFETKRYKQNDIITFSVDRLDSTLVDL